MDWKLVFLRNVAWPDLEKIQGDLIQSVQAQKNTAHLLISEPQPTFTYGRNSLPSELLWSQELIRSRGVSVFPVSRGGKWTYHGPGQILVYPILHLPSWGYSSKSVKAFLEDFRLGAQDGLRNLGCLNTTPQEPFGLYIANKKLVSFGLAFQRGISSHGLALYYTDQTSFFEGITPCGVCGGLSTSLRSSLETTPSWDSVANSLADGIKNRFSLRVTQVV